MAIVTTISTMEAIAISFSLPALQLTYLPENLTAHYFYSDCELLYLIVYYCILFCFLYIVMVKVSLRFAFVLLYLFLLFNREGIWR